MWNRRRQPDEPRVLSARVRCRRANTQRTKLAQPVAGLADLVEDLFPRQGLPACRAGRHPTTPDRLLPRCSSRRLSVTTGQKASRRSRADHSRHRFATRGRAPVLTLALSSAVPRDRSSLRPLSARRRSSRRYPRALSRRYRSHRCHDRCCHCRCPELLRCRCPSCRCRCRSCRRSTQRRCISRRWRARLHRSSH